MEIFANAARRKKKTAFVERKGAVHRDPDLQRVLTPPVHLQRLTLVTHRSPLMKSLEM